MSQKKKKNRSKQVSATQNKDAAGRENLNKPWIAMRTGLIIIAITSIAMAILTAVQVIPVRGWLEGIFWGLLFGALVWGIFFGFYFFRRLFR